MTSDTNTGGDAPLETIAVTALAAAAGATTLAWAGAVTASSVTFDPVAPSLAAAADALTQLPSHAAEPKAAWPPNIAEHLPGPAVYWTGQAVTVAVVLGAAIAGWRAWSSRARHPMGVRADAGLGRSHELGRLTLRQPQPGRVTLGRCGHRLLGCEPAASLAVIGPTGCGKTAGFAIPALLEWEGPIIATSVKADLVDATLAHRQERGHVWVYDPTSASGLAETATWSPLAACTTWHGAMRTAAWLAEAAQPRRDSVTDGDYWYTQARRALAPYLFAAAVSGRSTSELVAWVDSQEQNDIGDVLNELRGRTELYFDDVTGEILEPELPFTETIRRVVLDEDLVGDADAAHIVADSLWRKEERLRGSVFSTMENILAPWADPHVAASSVGNSIDFDKWLDGDNTIYVVAPAHEQARLRAVLSVLVQQAVRAGYDTANNRDDSRLAHPLLVLLDEAANIAPLPDLPAYAATARAHDITVVSIWQDIAQAESLYGQRAQTLLNNHRAKLFGSGIADVGTLDYLSKLVGETHRLTHTHSRDPQGRRSTGEQHQYRRLAPVDLLRRIRPGEALLIYGSELPAHVRLRPWYRDRTLRTRGGTI